MLFKQIDRALAICVLFQHLGEHTHLKLKTTFSTYSAPYRPKAAHTFTLQARYKIIFYNQVENVYLRVTSSE